MKRCLLMVFGLAMSLTALAADPYAQVTIRVLDDLGKPVVEAPVTASTFSKWVSGPGFGHDEYDLVHGMTDTNGVVVLMFPSKTGKVRYSVSAEGSHLDKMNRIMIGDTAYYRDLGDAIWFTNSAGGRWQPWSPCVDLEIKRVLNPIPMYARFLESWGFKVPVCNTPLGYDLVRSDWLPPYGRGEIADFVFTLACQLGEVTQDHVQYFDAVLTLTFSNDGDGILEYPAKPMQGSVLKLPRFAPETGYRSDWIQRASEQEGVSRYEHNEEQNFVFRIRTTKDDEGRIVSALYGKINGPIRYEVRVRGANMQMKYYLNPTPNDRNLEFDPKQNLFKDLKPSEQVWEP